MQAFYLLSRLADNIATAWRKRRHQHLSDALARELLAADAQIRNDIQRLIARTTLVDATLSMSKPAAMAGSAPARRPGDLRSTPVPGLPTHQRYSNA